MASTTIASPTKSALVLGATGAVGGPLLAALLAAPGYSRVRDAGRRVTSTDALPAGAAASGKLEQRTVDYEKMLAGDRRQGLDEAPWDVVFITCVHPR
jgi:nucleoside-diphosphate-sugar epimerase